MMKDLQIMEMAAKMAETITAAKMHDAKEIDVRQDCGEVVAKFYSDVLNGIYKTLESAFKTD